MRSVTLLTIRRCLIAMLTMMETTSFLGTVTCQCRSQVFGGGGVHENPDLPEAFHKRRMHEFANLD